MEKMPSAPTPENKEATEAEIRRLVEIPLSGYQNVYDRQSPAIQHVLEEDYECLTWEADSGPDREGVKKRFEEFFEHLNMLEQIDKTGSLT